MVKKTKVSSLLVKMNIRTILKSKLQFLAVILITAIAMTLFVGLTSNAKSIKNRVNELYSASNIADIWVTTSSHDGDDFYELKKLAGPNGNIEGRFVLPSKLQFFSTNALLSEELPTINKPATTDNVSTKDFFIIDSALLENRSGDSSLIKWVDEDGNYLPQKVQISISSYKNMLAKQTLGVFDGKEKTMLDIFSICLKDGATNIIEQPYIDLTFQVTGSMSFAENVQSSQMNTSSFLLDVDLFIQKIIELYNSTYEAPIDIDPGDPDFEFKTFIKNNNILTMGNVLISDLTLPNQYCIQIDDRYSVDDVKNNVENYFKNKDKNNLLICNTLNNLASNMAIESDIIQASQLAYIFPVIFFLVAILVVLTTISQIIIKERIQIGTLKSLGISTAQIVLHYAMLSIYIVLIGVVIGTILGPFILPLIMNQKYAILYSLPTLKFTISYFEAFISIILTLFATAFVTSLVTFQEAKLKPSEGIRPKQIKPMKANKKDKLTSIKLLPFKMAYRNIKVNLAKSFMVVLGVTGCTALLVCGFGIEDTLNKGIDTDIGHFFNADGYISYSNNESKVDKLLSIDGINYVEEYSSLPVTTMHNDITYQTYLNIYVDNSKFANLDGYDLKDKIVVSNKVANSLNVKVGDTINFSSLGINFEGEIGYILESFYMHGLFINSSYHNYGELSHVKTSAWISIDDGIDLKSIVEQIVSIDGISSCRSKQEGIDLINSYMSSITLMTLAVRVFAILLAVVVLYNLSLLNFKERMRDIATLKVLGFSNIEIAQSLIIESLFLTLVGTIIGLCFGLPMEILVLIVNLTPIVEFLYTVYFASYAYAFILTIGTALVVNIFLSNKIKKVQMVESLKSIE